MRDYVTTGKRKGSLNPYKLSESDGYLVNEVHDRLSFSGKKIQRAVFANVALKEADVTDCDFSYSVFINCYFRGAKFRGCNFTGCRFYECNFRGATLVDCRLQYSKWKETYVKKETVLSNIPSFPNIAQELLISLRMNAASIGEYDDARFYLYKSESLSRQHLRNIVTKYSDYYDKYSFWERVKASISLARSYMERFLWGYGERPGTLLVVASLLVSLFAAIFIAAAPEHFGFGGAVTSLGGTLSEAFQLSLLTFSGNLPNDLPEDVKSELSGWLAAESIFGIIFIAFLAASLHRKISTRRD